jgi:hypothetical protein
MREHSIECSGRIVLECKCGERIVLLGEEDDWYVEKRLTFACECGERLTLANRLNEGAWFNQLLPKP